MRQHHTRSAAATERFPRPAGDPFLARVGLMILGFVLLVPVAMILRTGGDKPTFSSSGLPGATALVEVGWTEQQAPVAAPSAALVPPEQAAAIAAAQSAATTPVGSILDVVGSVAPPAAVVADPASAAPLPVPAPLAPPAVAATTVEPAAAPSVASGSGDAGISQLVEVPQAAPASAAPPARVSDSPDCANTYEVVAGDYWVGIAKSHKVKLAEILDANGAGAVTAIYPGDVVCLPANASKPAAPASSTTAAAPATTKAPTATTKPAPATTKPATTQAPTKSTTTTQAPAPRRSYSTEEVQDIIRAVWPDDLEEKALVIAKRESGYSPTAKNYCCYGLFQLYWDVHKSWMQASGISSASDLYDPQVNAYAAYLLYQRNGGWGPWSQTNHD